MSNPARLLVLSGLAGAGTTSVGRALAARLGAVFVSHHAYPPAQASVERDALDPHLWPLADAVQRISEMDAVAAALERGQVVVWDTGDIAQATAVCAAVEALGCLTELVDADAAPALSELDRHFAALRAQLGDPSTRVILVAAPQAGARRRLTWALAEFDLVGLPVRTVVANRVPRTRDGWPKQWARKRQRRTRALRDIVRDRALGWLRIDEAVGAPSRVIADALTRMRHPKRVRASRALDVRQTTDGYDCVIECGSASRRVRIARMNDCLLLIVGNAVRLISLPPVVVRCTIVGASIVGEQLHVHAIPDPQRWRAAA